MHKASRCDRYRLSDLMSTNEISLSDMKNRVLEDTLCSLYIMTYIIILYRSYYYIQMITIMNTILVYNITKYIYIYISANNYFNLPNS